MLIVAGLLVVVISLLELLILHSLHALELYSLLVIGGANLGISALVAYFAFVSIRVPRPAAPAQTPTPTSAIRVVGDTLPLLRRGLNYETATKAARVMAAFEGVGAVVIADQGGILAAEGPLSESIDRTVLHERLQQAMSTRRSRLYKAGTHPVAVATLQSRGNVLGALGLVSGEQDSVAGNRELSRFAVVLGQLLAMQVELGQLDRQAQLVAEAELNALRAQINPHFLFNALNTIISYSRDDPQTTRRLLLRLADLFRLSMRSSGQMTPFADEYEHIKNYLYIEQARFREKLNVVYDIDPQVLKIEIPALSVQPLVENAIRHGLTPKPTPGTLTLRARVDFLAMRVVILVIDDGVGIESSRIPDLLKPRPPGHARTGRGLGLANINERLRRLYGEAYSLEIDSSPGDGARVTLRIPMR